MVARTLPLAVAAALLLACGASSPGASSPVVPPPLVPPPVVPPPLVPPSNGVDGPACTAACAGRQCGDDGCGGSCGACGAGTTCDAHGACVAPAPSSASCPAGQQCLVLERLAIQYSCTTPTRCEPVGLIGAYPTFDECRTAGCEGGNSTCGEQFGRSDPESWACEYCVAGCAETTPTACAEETAEGCVYGATIVPCVCG